MFGDLSEMMGKLKATQQKIEETKTRLDAVLIDESNSEGTVKVTLTANSAVRSIIIDPELTDTSAIEDYLVVILNRALTRANDIKESELAIAAKDGLPNIPGMDLFK